jgi:hypothetical protein
LLPPPPPPPFDGPEGPLGPAPPPPPLPLPLPPALAPPAPLAAPLVPTVIALFEMHGLVVMPIIPSSRSTMGAPMMMKQGPAVLRLTTSFSVPGSLPWQVFTTLPTVAQGAPLTRDRIAASVSPSPTFPMTG